MCLLHRNAAPSLFKVVLHSEFLTYKCLVETGGGENWTPFVGQIQLKGRVYLASESIKSLEPGTFYAVSGETRSHLGI